MNILALDSSGMTAAVAVVNEDAVLVEFNTNYKKTHSQTLLPMIDSAMRMIDMKMSDIDAVAVAKGPGSFTGLRIGAGTAKGLALAADLPIIAVSTLEAMAYTFCLSDKYICSVMDARRQQLYFGVYRNENGIFRNIVPDDARSCADVAGILNGLGGEVILTGDGLVPAEKYFEENLTVPFRKAPLFDSRQRAAVLGTLALEYANNNCFTDADAFAPVYLRPSQAERVRAEKNGDGAE